MKTFLPDLCYDVKYTLKQHITAIYLSAVVRTYLFRVKNNKYCQGYHIKISTEDKTCAEILLAKIYAHL